MNYSEIAFKIVNQVIKLSQYQSVTISAEIHNVYDFNDPLSEIPFLEEMALMIRKYNGLPILDISTENIHKRFFEEISEENKIVSTELLNKWLSLSDIFIDLSWRSNPIFYNSIPERTFKRLTLLPKDFLKLFIEKNKKLILLGYPTMGLAKYLDVDHETLKRGYFASLNANYIELKKKCYILDGKLKVSNIWNIDNERRTLKVELVGESKVFFGEFQKEYIITLPTGFWQQPLKIDSLNGIYYCNDVFYEQYRWKNIQIVFEKGKVTDVETDLQQKNINLLKSVLFFDADNITLSIGLNDTKVEKTYYSLFDMVRNKNISLIISSQKGQMIALCETAKLYESNEINILSEV